MKKAVVIPTNWCDPLLTGPTRVMGDPPFGCPDIERLLLEIQKRHDAAMKDAAKAERRRVRALVRKEVMKRSAEYMRDANDPKQKTMAAINAGRAWAFKDFCGDLLAALKEGR